MSTLLVLVALAVGVVSLVGIIRPLPHLGLSTRKRAAKSFGAPFLLLAIAGMLAPKRTPEELEKQKAEEQQKIEVASPPANSASANPAVVSADAWTDGDWPLTIAGGVLTCTTGAVFITDQDGEMWPLNGKARSYHARFGAKPELEPIWRVNRKLAPMRIDMGPLIKRGLALCD